MFISSCPRDNNQFAVPHSPPYIRNANLAGYEAEVCAYNLLLYLKLLHAKGMSIVRYLPKCSMLDYRLNEYCLSLD